MKSDTKKKWSSTKRLEDARHNLKWIKKMIENCVWCPPPRIQHGIKQCGLCKKDIDLDSRDRFFYAVWVGLICGRCGTVFEREIEELSKL